MKRKMEALPIYKPNNRLFLSCLSVYKFILRSRDSKEKREKYTLKVNN